MKWAREAEEAVSRVPFFVRKRVRKRVEEEAQRHHAREVTLKHVQACKQKFIKNMEDEVKGHQVETCFGPGGCPNRVCRGLRSGEGVGRSFGFEESKSIFERDREWPP